MFTLNETQLNLLASVRAWQEEGERRFEFWSRREGAGRRVGSVCGRFDGQRLCGGQAAQF